MPSKSIFRQPGARHFQLVHRSQRDPLIHDPDASKHVLKEFERENSKGKSRTELEKTIPDSLLAHDLKRANIGEAAVYGIYYDDTDYDYMKHLKPVGVQEDGFDSILIEDPVQKLRGKGAKSKHPIQLIELPPEALPTTSELPINYEAQEAIPSSIAGFQPDMDPHLRQTLEALEDDAFVDGDLEDDFFGELVAGGERDINENVDFEFYDLGEGVEDVDEEPDGAQHEGNWEAAFNKFKSIRKASSTGGNSDSDANLEDGDTVGSMPRFSVIGGKNRRKASSDASGYSMSSSSMFRNEGLSTLDEQFDQVEKEYASSDDDEDYRTHPDSDEVPELLNARSDFVSMMNQFMKEYEVVGGKMKHVLAGDNAIEKLGTLRKTLGNLSIHERGDNDEDDDGGDISIALEDSDVKDRWDCETVLTTYSNVENHPKLIRARDSRPVPKIRLDPRTGLPSIETNESSRDRSVRKRASVREPEDLLPTRTTVVRARDESQDEKKARKQAVKAERQARRVEKKTTKTKFTTEMHNQAKSLANREKTRLKKL